MILINVSNVGVEVVLVEIVALVVTYLQINVFHSFRTSKMQIYHFKPEKKSKQLNIAKKEVTIQGVRLVWRGEITPPLNSFPTI